MKLKTTVLLFAALGAAGAANANWTFDGDTTGSPTFNRPIDDDLGTLSTLGTAVHYRTMDLIPTSAGTYDFLAKTASTSYDPYTFLYENSFDPTRPLDNVQIGNDTFLDSSSSGFSFALKAGTNYVFVVTGRENSDFGAFTSTITAAAVPEPESWALMALGLGAVGLAQRRRGMRGASAAA